MQSQTRKTEDLHTLALERRRLCVFMFIIVTSFAFRHRYRAILTIQNKNLTQLYTFMRFTCIDRPSGFALMLNRFPQTSSFLGEDRGVRTTPNLPTPHFTTIFQKTF